MPKWIRNRWRQLRRKAGAHKRRNTRLREFVYLDEMSVYSLSVSRLGPVASEFTETESSSLRSELSSSVGVSAGLKSEVGSSLQQTRGNSTQVVRRAMIQSTFKDLHEHEEVRLKLATKPGGKQLTAFASTVEVERAVGRLVKHGWLIDPTDLVRGELIELEVELGTELIHQFNVTLATMLELFAAHPELIGPSEHRDLEMAKAARTVFDRMLVGLVPIRGRAVDYRVLRLGERDWIVRAETVDQLPVELAMDVHDLHIVGVAEENLFWKDIRRVVFSRSRFTVMARLSDDGLSTTWTPAKLLDVLRRFFPDVVPDLEHAVDDLIHIPNGDDAAGPKGGRLHAAIRDYAAAVQSRVVAARPRSQEELAPASEAPVHSEVPDVPAETHSEPTGAPADWASELPGVAECEAAIGSVAAVRGLFAQVTDDLDRNAGSAVDRTMARGVRDTCLDAAGLEPDGSPAMEARDDPVQHEPRAPEYLLDTEIVAIYW